jgi:hypothetical protein
MVMDSDRSIFFSGREDSRVMSLGVIGYVVVLLGVFRFVLVGPAGYCTQRQLPQSEIWVHDWPTAEDPLFSLAAYE